MLLLRFVGSGRHFRLGNVIHILENIDFTITKTKSRACISFRDLVYNSDTRIYPYAYKIKNKMNNRANRLIEINKRMNNLWPVH